MIVQAPQRRVFVVSLTVVILSMVGVGMLLPFLWMLATSLTTESGAAAFGGSIIRSLWPKPLVTSNYAGAWGEIAMGRLYLNTILVATATTLGQLLTSSLAGYAFARLHFAGRDKIFLAYLATMMVPSAVLVIPLYIMMAKLQWLDTFRALILPAVFTAYGTFMLRQFFLGIPTDLEDAARIDGCGALRIYWHVILPLSKPALATLAIFTFMATWRDFFWPLIVISSPEKFTLPLGLAKFLYEHNAKWTYLMAGTVMATIPVIVVFILAQRYFIAGIRLGAVKE